MKDEISSKKIGLKKKIICYNCLKQKGIANQIENTYLDENGDIKKVINWKAKGFQYVNGLFLCNQCDERKCERCGILLSNVRKDEYGKKNGVYYLEHPTYCKNCWDKIKL